MTTLRDLIDAEPGSLWTADQVKLIGRLLNRRVTGTNVYEDATGWHIVGGGKSGTPTRFVLLRLVELASDGAERDKIIAQRIKYKDNPPVAGSVEAYGEEFEVYPMYAHTYSSYYFNRSYRPLIGELKDEVLNPNLFFAYRCSKLSGAWILEHLLRMPAGVGAVDLDDIDASGGVSS